LADGILFERAGMPAVSVCTDAFRVPADAMARAYGFPGYEYVTVPHPVASRTFPEIQAMVEDMMPAVSRILGVES
jgi:hypothetical protein